MSLEELFADPAVLATVGVAAAASVYLYTMSAEPVRPPLDLAKQSIPSENGSGSRVSALVRDGKLVDTLYGDCRTLYDAFRRGAKLSGSGPCLGARTGPNLEYEYLTYDDVLKRARAFGSGLLANGVEPKSYVGLFAANCIDWVIAEQGCNTYSVVTVPLYDTLGPEAITHILNQAELGVVVCDPPKVATLLEQVATSPNLRLIIKTAEVTEEEKARAQELQVQIMSMAEMEAAGESDLRPDVPPSPDDIATVCYTSGTTGAPKGAMMSHKNLISDIAAIVIVTKENIDWNCRSVHLSYLPLAHLFERLAQLLLLCHGGRIGFFRGDVKLLLDDLAALKPTIFPSVPRLLNRVYDKVMDGVAQSGFITRTLFKMAMNAKRKEVAKGVIRKNSFWDKLVLNKVQARLGGNVDIVVTGAAPISDEVLDFLRCALGCPVCQGYGQTECAAASNISIVGDAKVGHVGPPIPCTEIKLVSVPELNYLAEDGHGEVCFRGPNVFKGYLKDEAKTKETIDEEGWLHSGDIGRWNEDGTLSIVDRKKQIFKLAQGEYIAPEKIELAYQSAPLIAQVYLHGDSLQSACVAVIVPDEVTLPRWAAGKQISGSLAELCEKAEVQKVVLDQITEFGQRSGLKSFEQAKALHLCATPFSVEDNLLTPTFKLKRPQLKQFFSEQIYAMYAKL